MVVDVVVVVVAAVVVAVDALHSGTYARQPFLRLQAAIVLIHFHQALPRKYLIGVCGTLRVQPRE